MKKLFIIFLFIFCIYDGVSIAQPQISWIRKFGASTWDVPRDIKCDNIGNIFVTGFFGLTTNNGKTPVLKYNLAGDTLWTRIFNPPDMGNSAGRKLFLDDSLFIYISGRYILKYNNSGNLLYFRYYNCTTENVSFDRNQDLIYAGNNQNGLVGPALLKCNKNGDSLWKKVYPQFPVEEVKGIAVDRQNNIVITARIYSGPSTDRDILTIKFDSVGNILWQKIYDGGDPTDGYDDPSALLLDSLGNIIVTGRSNGLDGGSNYYTVKYDPQGSVIWENRVPNPASGSTDMKKDNADNIYITGTTNGNQYSTIKYNSLGQLQWMQTVSGVAFQPPSSLTLDSARNVYVACNSYAAQNINQYQILKYNNNGNLLWRVTYLGNPVYHCLTTAIAVDNLGNVFVTGECQIPGSDYDFVTIKIDQSTGIIQNLSEIPKTYSFSQNYPNPFNPTTQINYELPNSDFVSLKVYDVNGKEIETLVNQKQNAGSYSVTFNAANYPSGIYFYKLTTEKFTQTKKMMLIK